MKTITFLVALTFYATLCNAQWTRISQFREAAGNDVAINVLGVHDGSIYIVDFWNRYTSRSDNGGQSWKKINSGMFSCMAFSGSKIYATDFYDIFMSTDKGDHWTKINSTSVSNVKCLLLVDTVLYAGVNAYGVYKTHDKGVSWTLLNKGFTGTEAQRTVSFLSKSTDKLFASTTYGLFASTDLGNNWSGLAGGGWPSSTGKAVASGVTAADGSMIYARVMVYPTQKFYCSENGGQLWKEITTVGLPIVIIIQDNVVIVGTETGVFSSIDHGITWTNEASGDFVDGKEKVSTLVSDGTFIYAGSTSDLWKRKITDFVMTGNDDIKFSDIEAVKVFPNPSSGYFSIQWDKSVEANLQILNITGELILNEQISRQKNIELLTSGIYLVKITDGKDVYSKKIVVF